MELLSATDLEITRNGTPLLRAGELRLQQGMRLGLTGRNGSGKSTLLAVLAGVETPQGGRVRKAPGLRVGYLPQRHEPVPGQSGWERALKGLAHNLQLERAIRAEERRLADETGSLERYAKLVEEFERAGGYGAEEALRESLFRLGLSEEALAGEFAALSGGERARTVLAATLASHPELLLLDEPGNHLDLPALRWLGSRLAGWRGALVLVSHDRALLDEVTTHTARLEGAQLQLRRGNYSRFREQQGLELRSSERQRRERRKERERLERTALELRSFGNAAAQKRRRRIERQLQAQAETGEESRRDPGGPVPPTPETRAAKGMLLEAVHLSRTVEDRRVLDVPRLVLRTGERVALLGANGSGKSTLLALLAGSLPSDDPRARLDWHPHVKLFSAGQHDRGLRDDATVLQQLQEVVSRERAHMLLSLCGVPPEGHHALPGELSGGERARAGLARLLADNANLLLLDEPGNDLDLEAVETLQQALQASDAAFVMATHDRMLASLADRIWSLEDGELVEYRGGVEGFLAGRRRLEPGVAEAAEGAPGAETASSRGERSIGAAQGGPEAGEQERLELELSGLEARLSDPVHLSERELQRLTERRDRVLDELSVLYDSGFEEPLPAIALLEGGLRLWAHQGEDGLIVSPAGRRDGTQVEVTVTGSAEVAHLVLRAPPRSEALPAVRRALLDGAVRLAFYLLAPAAVQHFFPGDPGSRFLRSSGDGWWTVTRGDFEAAEGWDTRQHAGGREGARRRRRARSKRSRRGAKSDRMGAS